MKLTFSCNGNDKQKQCWQAWKDTKHTEILYGGAKGGGKSYLGISIIMTSALMYPDTRYFIARHTLNDLRKYTYPDAIAILEDLGVPHSYYKYNASDGIFNFHNGSRVYFISCSYVPSDPTFARFGSLQFTQGFIEEAGEVCQDAKNNLSATLGRCNNTKYNLPIKLLMTCNPSNNFLYTDYYKPFREGTLEDWKIFIQALPTDNKTLPQEYIKNLERTLTHNQRQRLLYGYWEFDDNPDLLVTYDAVCDVFTNGRSNGGERVISADMALQGRDRCVVTYWEGDTAIIKRATVGNDAKEVADYIERLARENNVGRSRVVVDSDGLGSYLSSYIKGVFEFHNGAKAYDSKFANLKTQCAYRLASMINERRLRVECTEEQREEIKRELMLLVGDSTESKLGIISKEEMKQVLGHSPDYLDSLLMGMATRVKEPPKGMTQTRLRPNL